MVPPERRVVLTGESPVRVSAGAPGSRLQPGGEIRPSRAECRRKEVKQIIAELAPVLRGWGNYFRSGYADREFQSDGFLGEEESPSLAVSAKRTAPHEALPFYRPTALQNGPASSAGCCAIPGASHTSKIIVKPCAGKRHARFERGSYGAGPLLSGTSP